MEYKAVKETKNANPDFTEYKEISKEVDAITEMINKIQAFLETGQK